MHEGFEMIRTDLNEILEILEKEQKIYNILKECPYQILRELRLKKYPKGGFYLRQGNVYDIFYIIVDGEADIFVESEQGKKFCITTYKKGDFLGELEIFEKRPYMSSVKGKDKVTTLEIKREHYLKWLEMDTNFSQYILKTLCSGTYVSMQKMGGNTLYTLKQRICHFLIENTNTKGILSIELNAELLSESMGVTKRSVNRVLKELKDRDIIEIDNSKLSVKNYKLLLEEKI